MPGQRMAPGEHGDFFYRTREDGRTTAFVWYRNHAGRRRRIEATASSRSGARKKAITALERALAVGGDGEYDARTTFREVAMHWLADLDEKVVGGRRSPATAAQYRHVLDKHVFPALGDTPLPDLTTARVDRFLRALRAERGYSVAKLCRSVVSGVCGLAVRREGLRVNPVRDASPIESDRRRAPRALTVEECMGWLRLLDADPYSRAWDLPDLTRFLLGTGCRLGEAIGANWDDLDWDRGQLHVRRTVGRVKGQGLVARRPKSLAGERVLGLPSWLVNLLAERRDQVGEVTPIFPGSRGGYRDVNSVEKAYRRVRAGTAYEWVVPHTYRKTVATLLDAGGLSARTIADQLGHSRVSMTQDVYMGRRAVEPGAALMLGSIPGFVPKPTEDPLQPELFDQAEEA